MQHPQAHTEVTVWLKGTSIPEQEAARTRVWPTASSSLPSWHGQTSMVPLDQPNLYLSSLTLAISGARGSIGPTGQRIRLPGQPVGKQPARGSQALPQRQQRGTEGAEPGQGQGDTAQGTQLQHLSGGHGALPGLSRAQGRAAVPKEESRDRRVSPAEAVLGPQGLPCTALGMKLPQACGCSTQEGLDCCTDLDSSSVGMSSLLPGQFCDPISPSCSDCFAIKTSGKCQLTKAVLSSCACSHSCCFQMSHSQPWCAG